MPLKFSQTFHLMPTPNSSFVVTNGERGGTLVCRRQRRSPGRGGVEGPGTAGLLQPKFTPQGL